MRKNSFKLWVTQQESCRIPKLIHCTITFDILFVSVPLWSNITQICNARVNSGRSHCWAFSPEPQRASSHAQRHPTSQRIAVCDRWLQLQNQLIPVRREPDTSSSLTLICVTCSCGEDNIFSITPVVTCERIPHYSIYSCGFIFNSVICDLRENVLVLRNWRALTHRGLCILTHVHNPTPAQKLISQGAGLAQMRTMVFEHSRCVALSEDSLCELHGIAKSYHIWNLIGAWQTRRANTHCCSPKHAFVKARTKKSSRDTKITDMMRDLVVIVFLMRAKSNTTSKYFIQSIIFRIIHFLMLCSRLQLEKEKIMKGWKESHSITKNLWCT